MFSKDVVRPYFAYVMNTSLGDNLVGVTDQLFKIIPYNVIRIDFSKVNSLCCKSLPPNLKSQIKILLQAHSKIFHGSPQLTLL